MNEHLHDPSRPSGDPLTRELRGLVSADYPAPEGGARAAVRTVRRRVVGRVAASTALVAALAVGVPFGLAMGGTSASPLLVATQEPSPTAAEPSMPALPLPEPSAEPSVPSTSPEPVASEVAPVEPSEPVEEPPAPSPTAPPVAPVLEVTATTTGPATAGDLAGLALASAEDLEVSDAGAPASWALGSCEASGAPLDEERTGWAAQDLYGADSGILLSVASYPDEATAVRALDALAARAASCLDGPAGPPGASWVWRERSRSDEALQATARWYEPAPAEDLAALTDPDAPGYGIGILRPGQFVSVVREGRFVALGLFRSDYGGGGAIAAADGETDPSAGTYPADADRTAQQYVDDVMEQARSGAARAASAAAALAG